MAKYKQVNEKRILQVVVNKTKLENKGLFIAKETATDNYIVCDNTQQEAFTEVFADKNQAVKWLLS